MNTLVRNAGVVRDEVVVDEADRVTIELPNIGLGTMRTSATYIALLLQLEDGGATEVLVSAAQALGITLEEITAVWNDEPCELCGVSLLDHDHGRCP